jgi:hypothetical protein
MLRPTRSSTAAEMPAVNQLPAAQAQRNRWETQHESLILAHLAVVSELNHDLFPSTIQQSI